MIELFTDGLQLKFNNIAKYDGKNIKKAVSYFVIVILSVSLVVLINQYTKINFDLFEKQIAEISISIEDNHISDPNLIERLPEINQGISDTGFEIDKSGLTIDNVGLVSYEILNGFSGNQSSSFLKEMLFSGEADLKGIVFVTLYLNRLPYILVAIITLFILQYILKKNIVKQVLSKREAMQMTISLVTLPSLGYLCLKAVGLKESMALFIFVSAFVLINFFYSRQFVVSTEKENERL